MAVQGNDLLLVQRGNTPFRETATNVSNFVTTEISTGNVLPPTASASQLGVIRVGTNLTIDGSGILSAVIPAGLTFMGEWSDALNPPNGAQNGQFWVWEGANATLTNADWGHSNGRTVSEGDRLLFDDSPDWTVVAGGGGGITSVAGTAPIQIGGTPEVPDVSIDPATDTTAGSMSGADKAKLDGIAPGAEVNVDPTSTYTASPADGTLTLQPGGDTTTIPLAVANGNAGLMSGTDKETLDNLVANPGGVVSVGEGVGIDITGTGGAPIVNVEFGTATPNGTPTTVMPFDISVLGDLP